MKILIIIVMASQPPKMNTLSCVHSENPKLRIEGLGGLTHGIPWLPLAVWSRPGPRGSSSAPLREEPSGCNMGWLAVKDLELSY